MKYFILRVLFFCLLIFAILITVFTANLDKVILSANKYDYIRNQSLYSKKNEVNALTLGNSRSIGIDFKTLQLNGFHYWRAGGDLDETRIILKEVCRDLPELQEVFIPIYFTALIDNKNNEGLRRPFYSLRPLSAPISGDYKNWVISKLYFFGSDYEESKLDPNDIKGFSLDDEGVIILDSLDLLMSIDSLLIRSRERAQLHSLKILNSQNYNRDFIDSFKENILAIIHTAQFNNIRLIFYTPPMFYEYDRIMRENIKIDLMDDLAEICMKNKIEYYNFSQEEGLIHDFDLFLDPDHLNVDCGAIVFSQILKKRMLIFEHHNSVEPPQ